MKKHHLIFSLFLCLGISSFSHAWGPIGHYVIGMIAEQQLNKKTVKKVEKVLQQESISGVGVWMDNIRSDKKYDYTRTWHWITTVDGTYDPSIQEESGDAFKALNELIANLKSGKLSAAEERDQLRMLIHIVGDLHQPLHVGQPGDRGGNDVKIEFFKKQTNLHAIWDSDLIESKKMSYTEISRELQKRITPELIKKYQNVTPEHWLKEAVSYRPAIYNLPENGKVGYEYIYQNYHIIEERLTAAGIRLAMILEEIYGR